MTEYDYFINKYFPETESNQFYDKIYQLVCKNNLLTDTYLKYSDIQANAISRIFLERYKWGLNKILLYVPINEGIGINGCVRYTIEQFLKFLYAICFTYDMNKINKTSYRHLKEDLKLRDNSIRIKQGNLEILYTYYAKYSNDVHDKNEDIECVEFLEEILKGTNEFVEQVYSDLIKVTKVYDEIMIHFLKLTKDKLSMAEMQRMKRTLSNKQFEKIELLMKNEENI